jgi:hypothetical protein
VSFRAKSPENRLDSNNRIRKRDDRKRGSKICQKTTVSNAGSYQEIGAYWDKHDATEFGEQEPVEFDVQIRSQRHYFPVEGQPGRN